MQRTLINSIPSLKVNLGQTILSIDISWLIVLPLSAWGIATLYLPDFGNALNPGTTWLVTVIILLLATFSLIGHIFAHVYAARWVRFDLPDSIRLLVFGDPGQIWPTAPTAWKEVVVAAAGPFLNALIAVLAYLLWNAQLNSILNLSMPFIGVFNIGLVLINLTPAFPLDGGRIVRAIGWGLFNRPLSANRLAFRLGYILIVFLVIWGIFLIVPHYRYSIQTGLTTITLALLIEWGLVTNPSAGWHGPDTGRDIALSLIPRIIVATVILAPMLIGSASLLLTNNGLEAPGVALSVEPMIQIPSQYSHQHSGTFILTSVLSESPVPAGGWLLGQLTPAIKILPPEKITPNQVSPQESARQGFRMLNQSEIVATVVGLRLAGYKAEVVGKGVTVDSILPESRAAGLLKPGDVVTSINGIQVESTGDLINQVKIQKPDSKVRLLVNRDQQNLDVVVQLMPPAQTDGTPKLGIAIEDAGFDYKLPFPAKIVSQKIVGGPSAGLMFTLTMYNALIPNDLTGGRKIAGTGTISPDGTVGPIGGVQQKVAAAEATGAEYFLSPVENYADALAVARHIKVIKIANVQQAVDFLRSLPK